MCTVIGGGLFGGVVALVFGAERDTISATLVAAAAGLIVGWAVYDGINRRRARPDDQASDYEDQP